MNSDAKRILKILKWNKSAWNFETVEKCCDLAGIEMDTVSMSEKGLFWMPDGIPSILLSDKLRGIHKLAVATHELGHFFSDMPESALYSPKSKDKREFLANKFSIIAMIPQGLMRKMLTQYSLWDEYNFGAQRLEFRYRIWKQCGE